MFIISNEPVLEVLQLPGQAMMEVEQAPNIRQFPKISLSNILALDIKLIRTDTTL